ncbi:ABC transporter permease [Spiroplasma endosymbiont of Crioceris asparagi]|uniref:ABC transporter permease n=1 Tax=Spiroplasma endosymbiont of Crioceris asparagi TaxID=3066286 RepID=UPI0030CE9766
MKEFKIKGGWPEFKELFLVIGKSFFREVRGPLFLYFMPIFFMILFYYTMGSTYDKQAKVSLLFAYTLIPALTIVTSLAPSLVNWKNSIFLKRLETAGLSKTKFLLTLYLFYFLAGLSGIAVQLTFALMLGGKPFIDALGHINALSFILGIVLVVLMCIAISSFLGGISSNEGSMQGIVMLIYFINLFLAGIMLPLNIVETTKVMHIVTYLIPLKYAAGVYNHAINEDSFIVHANNGNVFTEFNELWQPAVGALAIIAALFIINKFTFKWSAKK